MLNINKITCGDNLYNLEQMPNQSVDLVYLDPPHATGVEWKQFGNDADNLHEYIEMLQPRLQEIHRVLANDGSLFFQIDWRIDVFIQALLNEIFGRANLIAKIIWLCRNPSALHRFLPNTYDVILFYGKSQHVKYFPQYMTYTESEIENRYKYKEPETGRRYRLVNITSPKIEHSKNTYEFLGVTRTWRFSKEKMEEEYKQGRIIQSRHDSVPMRKQYMSEGKLIGDVWSDLPVFNLSAAEKTGYPTQKPIDLLQRIIQMSTKEGDLVLDPFCGSGTTLVAAEELFRNWIGIDISPTACQIAAERLSQQNSSILPSDILELSDKKSYKEIQALPFYEFENWVLASLNELMNNEDFMKKKRLQFSHKVGVYSISHGPQDDVQVADISGSVPVQVKQRELEAKDINAFAVQLMHHKRNKGIYIALGFSKQVLKEIEQIKETGLEIIAIHAQELTQNE